MSPVVAMPTNEIRTVTKRAPLGRKIDEDHSQVREWLFEVEIEALITAAIDSCINNVYVRRKERGPMLDEGAQ